MVATTNLTERFVELSHGKSRIIEAGTGDPVMLIHGAGFTSGADSWLLNIPALAERFHVIAMDALGFGFGDRLNTEYSFAYLVDHVRELQDVLGIEKAHMVGHSMGGWIVSLLAYESPNRVDKLVLVAAGGTATRPLQNMVQFKAPSRDEIRTQMQGRYSTSDIDIEPLVARYAEKSETAFEVEAFSKIMQHMTAPLTRSRYNTLRRLPYITAPTLVVWGRDDAVNALEMGEESARLIPGAKLVVFDNTGHGVPTERPTEFNQALLEFL